jgi:hypothetical protein
MLHVLGQKCHFSISGDRGAGTCKHPPCTATVNNEAGQKRHDEVFNDHCGQCGYFRGYQSDVAV